MFLVAKFEQFGFISVRTFPCSENAKVLPSSAIARDCAFRERTFSCSPDIVLRALIIGVQVHALPEHEVSLLIERVDTLGLFEALKRIFRRGELPAVFRKLLF